MMCSGFRHQDNAQGWSSRSSPVLLIGTLTSYCWKTKVFARCWNAWRTWALSKTATPK